MNQFILEIKQLVIPPNSTMVTVAVISLYTNIPHDEGINSILKSNPQKPPAEIFVDLFLKTTLEFNSKCFKQLYIIMGIKLALAYANTFIGYIEDNLLSQHNLAPFYYHWFINEIFPYLASPLDELQGFIDKMNQFTPLLNSHTNLAPDIITFLDINVHLNNIKLYFTTHIKSTNKQAYIHTCFFHPPGMGKGIAIGEAKRYARTNTCPADFQNSISKHIQQMKTRGYNSKTSSLVFNILIDSSKYLT